MLSAVAAPTRRRGSRNRTFDGVIRVPIQQGSLLPVMSTVAAACNAADRGATLRYVHRSLLVSDLRDRQHPVFVWRRTWWKQRANSNNGVVLDLQ